METTIAETGLVQSRASQASRPKPKRFKLKNNEAWDRLRDPIISMIGQYPGLKPGSLAALLGAEGYLGWIPRDANAVGVVSRVLRRLEKSGAFIQANGWFRLEDVNTDDISRHEEQQAKRGLRTATNAIGKAKDNSALGGVDSRVKKGVRAASEHMGW